jgi:hypothetical protein
MLGQKDGDFSNDCGSTGIYPPPPLPAGAMGFAPGHY